MIRIAFVSGLVAAAAGAAAQTVLYQTGFESPPFSPGELAGQDGFQVVGSPQATSRVQTAVVRSGSQAVTLDAGGTAPRWAFRDTPFLMGTGGQDVLIVEWDMRVSAPGSGPGQGYGVDLYSSTVDRIMALVVEESGEVVALLDNEGNVEARSGFFPPDNQWHAYRLVLDFSTGRADVAVNGATVIRGAAFHTGAGRGFNDADLWALPPGTRGDDVAHFDNLSIRVDDEPPAGCYPDCDTSTGVGVLDIFDFLCFQNRYDLGDPYACDCDTSTGPGVCDIFDFLCFQNAYDAGCP